jgi:hypothetical protein
MSVIHRIVGRLWPRCGHGRGNHHPQDPDEIAADKAQLQEWTRANPHRSSLLTKLLAGEPVVVERSALPHVLLVAPRAKGEIVFRHFGTLDHWYRRWCWPVLLDGYLRGLVDEVAQRLGEPVDSITHRCRFGSSVR